MKYTFRLKGWKCQSSSPYIVELKKIIKKKKTSKKYI